MAKNNDEKPNGRFKPLYEQKRDMERIAKNTPNVALAKNKIIAYLRDQKSKMTQEDLDNMI